MRSFHAHAETHWALITAHFNENVYCVCWYWCSAAPLSCLPLFFCSNGLWIWFIRFVRKKKTNSLEEKLEENAPGKTSNCVVPACIHLINSAYLLYKLGVYLVIFLFLLQYNICLFCHVVFPGLFCILMEVGRFVFGKLALFVAVFIFLFFFFTF